MRLTLRTLLAWLDDALPPTEVREIGRQVSESPVAQELKEKIARVTRQRRLTVPPSSGADAVDPNFVAAYIDNELTPEEVTSFEKKCLTSDVHLAEVASVHQILSGIGQKAKVPDAARTRMYQLVKGRESVGPDVPRTFAPPPPPRDVPAEPWSSEELPARRWLERLGPGTAVLGLILLLGWLVWANLSETAPPTVALTPPTSLTSPARVPDQPEPAPPAPSEEVPAAEPEKAETTEETTEATEEEVVKEPVPELVPGAAAMAGPTVGVVLVSHPGSSDWDRLEPKAPLNDGDRLLGLTPSHDPLQFPGAQVLLVGDDVVRVRTPSAGLGALLDFDWGRLLIQKAETPVGVGIAGRVLKLTPPPDGVLGLQRVERRTLGGPNVPPSLQVFVLEGEAVVESPAGTQTLSGPSVLEFDPQTGRFAAPLAQPPPAWVADPAPAPQEEQLATTFAGFFKAGTPALSALVEASEDPSKEVFGRAIAALATIGHLEEVASLVSAEDRPAARRSAIAALRSASAQGPAAQKEIRTLLEETWGAERAGTVEQLLRGYSAARAKDEATLTALVELLSSPDAGIRELAIENLQALTGRDRMQYDPDQPDGPGLQAWKDLLTNRAAAPAEPPTPKTP